MIGFVQMGREKMKLIDTARKMMGKSLDDDPESVLDGILGSFLVVVCTVFVLIVGAVMLITVPIWGLPYLLIKSYWSKKDV